jgi:hypothetical protein
MWYVVYLRHLRRLGELTGGLLQCFTLLFCQWLGVDEANSKDSTGGDAARTLLTLEEAGALMKGTFSRLQTLHGRVLTSGPT